MTLATGEIDIQITIPCSNAPDFVMKGKAHITPNLRPNMLVGTDLLNQYKCNLNFDQQVITFPDGRTAPMKTTRERDRTSRVFATKTIVLMPNVLVPIKFHYAQGRTPETT